MIGRYDIELYNNKVHYHLNIKRNITVLRGDSASGKSELIRLLSVYNANPESSGITLISEKACNVLTEENWKLFIESYQERIFFIDEGNSFLNTTEFASAVKSADHYFVIISRERLPQLPYSIEEIYGLREGDAAGKYRNATQIYNEMYQLYTNHFGNIENPEVVITEDSNSGYDFFSEIYPDKCIPAGGKSNVQGKIIESKENEILAIVDGAAFGPEMQACMELVNTSPKSISLYAPESFEYLILKSGLIKVPKDIVEETWNYADSKKYCSWEDYYTSELCDRTRNGVGQYSKRQLNGYYITKGSMEKICKCFPWK
ncbi:MAG: translation initiation factor 2 [Pseudobutyrivibrio sp.]|nr:translation initiation factor 2 [Pseudobutyrivibrio sp.]